MDPLVISAVALGVLCIDALLAFCQASLVKLRYSSIDSVTLERLKTRWAIRRVLDDSNRTAQVLRFGIAACAVMLGFLCLMLFQLWVHPDQWGFSGPHWLWQGASLIPAVLMHYLVAETLPRRWVIAMPQKVLRHTAWVVCLFEVLSFPLRAIINGVAGFLTRILGIDGQEELNALDVEVQLGAMGKDPSTVSLLIRRILSNAIQMSKLTVQDIVLPRHQIQSFDLADTLEANLELAKETGHTRFPLCEGDLDHCIGIIHIKDIFRYRGDLQRLELRNIKRKIVSLNLDLPLEKALKDLLRWKVHMALVRDEFGGAVGVVTLERILEELVGSIQDEFDEEEALIVALSENIYNISGLSPVHDVEEALGIRIDAGEVSTFGGLITTELGRIPKRGERLNLTSMEILVEDVDEKRVISAKVWVVAEEKPDDEPSSE